MNRNFSVALIYVGFFFLIGLTAVLTDSPGALLGLAFIAGLPDLKS